MTGTAQQPWAERRRTIFTKRFFNKPLKAWVKESFATKFGRCGPFCDELRDFCTDRAGIAFRSPKRRTPDPLGIRRSGVKPLAMTYSCMAKPHYHRRGCVSLPSSGWDRVVPQRYGHQGDGWRVRSVNGFWPVTRARSRVRCCVIRLDVARSFDLVSRRDVS